MFRSNKFNVTLSAYSFELLLNFLNDARFMLLLSIVNQYLSIKVVQGRYGLLFSPSYSPLSFFCRTEWDHLADQETGLEKESPGLRHH